MITLLKAILQLVGTIAGLIIVIAIVIAVHKNSEQQTASAQASPPSQNDRDTVHFDPQQQQKFRIMEAVIQRTRGCLRQIQASLLYQGVRNRKELIERSTTTCKRNATADLSTDLQDISLAGLPLLAEQELESVLRYGLLPGEIQTIRP